ncbi:MAG: NAD(P)/FAD-dependent oxidoreductase [Phycisphaerales bacterium]
MIDEFKSFETAASRRVGVVGGGIAGLAAARVLAEAGVAVKVFDKGRGPGGRASTRRVEQDSGTLAFDHGAQYFTVRADRFATVVEGWVSMGACAPWNGQIATIDSAGRLEAKPGGPTRFVGTPRMNAVVAQLVADLPRNAKVQFSARVDRVEHAGGGWLVEGPEDRIGTFDALIVTAPAPQVVELMPESPELAARAAACVMHPCWAVMAAFDARLPIEADGIFVNVPGNPLSWLARDSSKPGRSPGERWILHAGPEWSMAHVDDDRSSVVCELLESMQAALQLALPPATYSAAHRWRYALTSSRVDGSALFDRDRRVAIAGDWCNGGRVEGAFLSGCAAADMLLRGFESKSS